MSFDYILAKTKEDGSNQIKNDQTDQRPGTQQKSKKTAYILKP